MKRFLTCFLLFAVVLFSAVALYAYALPGNRGGGAEERTLSRISKELGVDLSAGTLVRFEDSHGGFHGDGLTTAEVELEGAAGGLSSAPGWKSLPMSENAARAVRLCEFDSAWVSQGFYYLYDSQSEDPYDDAGLHNRYSWNFTVAVYDSQCGRLYFYKLDT